MERLKTIAIVAGALYLGSALAYAVGITADLLATI